jgi:anti-sigma regulatory factor (Ser/Thr protein kinase)
MLDWLEEVARAKGIEPNSLRPLQLAIEEVFANCVRHNASGSGRIEVRVETEGSRFRVAITDPDTDGFDPRGTSAVRTDLPLEERKPGGLGLHLIRAMVDHIDYRQDGRRAVTVLVKTLE